MGVSGIVVPVPAADPVVGEWRSRWDPAAALAVPAHVTLLTPFVSPPVPPSVVEALRAFFALVAPWEVTYERLGRFPGGVLYVSPSPADRFVALTSGLVAAWPDHPPYGGAYDTVVPHLTVCDGAPDDVLDAAAAEVAPRLPVTAWAREAWLLSQPAEGAPYALEARLPFGA